MYPPASVEDRRHRLQERIAQSGLRRAISEELGLIARLGLHELAETARTGDADELASLGEALEDLANDLLDLSEAVQDGGSRLNAFR